MRFLAILIAITFAANCSPKNGSKDSQSSNKDADAKQGEAVDALVVSDTGGVISGKFDADLKVPQTLTASETSSISESSVTMPAGTFAIDTVVEVEEARSIATASGALSLGIDADDVSISSKAVSMVNEHDIDADKEVTVSLQIDVNGESALNLTADRYYVVFYHVWRKDLNKFVYGVIVSKDLTITKTHAIFKTKFFGTYQLAYMGVSLKEALELATADTIDKNEQAAPLAPSITKKDVETQPNNQNTPAAETPATLKNLVLQATSKILAEGEVVPLQATAEYSDGSTKDVTSETTWESSDSSITLQSGTSGVKITGINTGTSTIKGTYNGSDATMQISVASITVTSPSEAVWTGYDNPVNWGASGLSGNVNIYYAYRAVETSDPLVWTNGDACLPQEPNISVASNTTWDPDGCYFDGEFEYYLKIESADFSNIYGISDPLYIEFPQ